MARQLFMGAFFIAWGLCAACSGPPVPFGDAMQRVSSPSLLSAPSTIDLERLAKTDDCAGCHSDVASHWMHSAHAYASFDNPWYRTSVDEFREHRGAKASRFCAGCHDPLLLLSGDIDRQVKPENELAYAGITCLVCHSVESTRPDGNGSFTLTDRPVLIPDPAVPAEIEAHRERLAMPTLRSAALCGSCHRSFSGPAIGNEHHLPGIDDLGDWSASAFAGSVPNHWVAVAESDCRGCHMTPEPASTGDLAATDGLVSGHRWAASHTAMAAQLPDRAQGERVDDTLVGSVVIDIGATRVNGKRVLFPEEAAIRGGEHVVFDVVLQNAGVGHRFPGGTRDMHDVWVEIDVRDASGRLLAVSRPSEVDNDDVFVLRSTMLDASADPEILHQVHRFATPAFDRTLPTHDAQIVRYELTAPNRASLPLRIDSRLMHRKHSRLFQRAACEASRTERGKAFAHWAQLLGKVALDPCNRQPLTVIASATAWMGNGATDEVSLGGAARPTVERLLDQALGLLRGTQEHLELTKPSLHRALVLASASKSKDLIARVELLFARLASVQGRTEDAVAAARRAEALVGPHPVFDRVRGDAYARVWRWSEAAEAYRQVVEASPGDWTAWRALARAYGSLADDQNALAAAELGLRLAPRDESLLRSRSLALTSLGHPDAAVAEEAWLQHRTPDSAPKMLAACERDHVRCRTDRQPIPQYTLSPPPRKAIHATAKLR
ncbi:MAG: multiheme c-type cytochrome [Myxococcales bacterium]|nr:multiheme c-type cytochrome [Myxococcales bacterium]MDH3483923.1 multiheme c-type cytochrome [Myxococcales bacterium]